MVPIHPASPIRSPIAANASRLAPRVRNRHVLAKAWSSKQNDIGRETDPIMQSPFTWIALVMFTGLAALMLQRSISDRPLDKLWFYAPPAVGCAIMDYLGHHGFVVEPIIVLVLIVTYIMLVFRATPTRG